MKIQNSKFKIKNYFKSAGFTLIELILYVSLVAIFITAAISFAWDITYGREKAYQQQIVDQNARAALARISYEIRRAYDIQSISDFQIVLDNQGATTTIDLSGTRLRITTGGLGPYNLTSNQVIVGNTNPIFRDLRSVDNNSKNIGVSLTLNQANPPGSFQFTAVTTVYESIELNSQFNQARRLLVNVSGANLVAGTSLQGITIQNTGSGDVVIDKLSISWSGTVGGENVTEVQIGGGVVEWTGLQPSGSTLELSDFTLTVVAGVVSLDYINFNASMSGATINLGFVMLDGSVNRVEVVLAAGATPTPTPTTGPTPTPTPAATPTPTPVPTSCSQVCLNNGYTTGTCRKNAAACSASGEVYVPAGDPFCTGGVNADTCCCQP